MSRQLDGWYYLHANGDLIYKRDLPGIDADFRESAFVRAFWPLSLGSREDAWTILVESLACGAQAGRIQQLADHWRCTDEDAESYGHRVGCVFVRDGDQWFAHRLDFINLQESPSGFGRTKLEAAAALANALGFRPSKLWGPTFKTLLALGVPI